MAHVRRHAPEAIACTRASFRVRTPRLLAASSILAASWLLAAAFALRPLASTAADTAGDADVVARVGSGVVTRGEIEAACREGGGPGFDPALPRPQREAAALEQLVDHQLLLALFDREGVTVSDAEIDAARERMRTEPSARAKAAVPDSPEAERRLRTRLRLRLAAEKFLAPRLTEKLLAAELERYRRDLDGTLLLVSHIVLRPDVGVGDRAVSDAVRRAEEIRRDLLAGRLSFPEAARRHSAGPSRHSGGAVGWIARNGPCVEDFAARAFALAKGEVSQPFVTDFGVHLVTVNESQPGRLSPAEIRPRVRALVMDRMLGELVARMRTTATVEYAAGVPRFDPATPAGTGRSRRVIVGSEPVRVGPDAAATP